MINAFSRDLALNADGIVKFDTVTLEKGCGTVLNGSSSIHLKKSGIYQVIFYAEAMPQINGTVSFAMLTNGFAKIGDTTTVEGATTAKSYTVPIVTTVQVPANDSRCNCRTSGVMIQFENVGVATTADVNVVITKVC